MRRALLLVTTAALFCFPLAMPLPAVAEEDAESEQIGDPASLSTDESLLVDLADDPSDFDLSSGEETLPNSDTEADADGAADSNVDGMSLQAEASNKRWGDWEYTEDESYFDHGGKGGVVVTDYYGSNNSEITVPSQINGKNVTVLLFGSAVSTSRLKNNLVTINIPSTVQVIYSSCFRSFKMLKNVNFPNGSSLSYIGSQAFEFCVGLETFAMPASLTNLGASPFYGCQNMKRLTFNDVAQIATERANVIAGGETYSTEWHTSPVSGSQQVEYVVPAANPYYKLQNGLLMSKDGTIVYGVSGSLHNASVTVPSGVKTVGKFAFYGYDGLAHLALPASLTRIEEYAFGESGLQELAIPDSVTYVGGHIAENCTRLRSVVIGNGVTELGNDAGYGCFYNCTGLTSLTLGNKVQVIANSCFAQTALTQVYLPASVKELDYGAFGNCDKLASVTGGEGLQNIYTWALCATKSLTSFPLTASSKNYEFVAGDAFAGSAYTPSYPAYLAQNGAGDYVRYDATLRVTGNVLYSEGYKVLDLVNQERKKQGLSQLVMDKDLLEAAVQRAAETSFRWSHTRPDGENFNTVKSTTSWGYLSAENIAAGQANAGAAVNSWMNSSGHKANILSSDYAATGIAAFKHNGKIYWVQVFGSGSAKSVSKPSDASYAGSIMLRSSEYAPTFSVSGADGIASLGGTAQLGVTAYNGAGTCVIDGDCVDWDVSDSSIATVSASGLVTGKAAGKVSVSAKLDKSTKKFSAEKTLMIACVQMYRLYNRVSGEHLNTKDLNEYNTLTRGKTDWQPEGKAWLAPARSGTPVYRLYNLVSGDHHYTTDLNEYKTLQRGDWKDEGVGWYSDDAKGVPVYRLFTPSLRVGGHHFTKDLNEYNKLPKLGNWRQEGIAWYGVKE